MTSLPLPVRVAAGLAATALEHARHLPAQLVGLPVTVASQALQLSMRVQQQVTELAIKGDEALAALRPVEEAPEWATFDEDDDVVVRPSAFDRAADDAGAGPAGVDPWEREERAFAGSPAAVPNYDELTLAQLRARLRQFSVDELEELLAYERAGANRSAFTGMLTRRIAAVREQR